MKKRYRILFPSKPYNLKQVDEAYEAEKNLCELLGIQYYLFDYDTFVDCGLIKTTIDFEDKSKPCTIIYRGWMLKPLQYKGLCDFISSKSDFNIFLINNTWEYTNCHCFPHVYGLLKQYTPRIKELPNFGDIYTDDIEFDFFIKDHVKSNKIIDGVERLSKNIYKDELVDKIGQFVKDRGKLFTGNIVLKEFVDLKKINGKTNEWRVFYADQDPDELKHQSHLPSPIMENLLCYFQNSYLKTTECPPRELMTDVGRILSHTSNFFTVDFALTENDDWIVIETGDGQVSGLPIGEEFGFYNYLVTKLNI